MIDMAKVKEGDIVQYWFDTGCMGVKPCYATVLKVCPKKLKVRGERGEVGYKRPEFFDKIITEKFAAELRADGVNI